VQSHQDDWDRHWADFAQANDSNPAQAYRQKLVLDLLRESGRGERILDIGSGTGALAAELHRFFPRAEIVGIELSREGVERSRITVPSATFVQRDLLRADDIDSRLMQLLSERRVVSKQVQQLRVQDGGSRVEHSRENAIIRRWADTLGDGGAELALAVLAHCRGRV